MGEKTRKNCNMLLINPKEIDLSNIDNFLNHDETYIRSSIAQVLGQRGGRYVYPLLVNLMRDHESDVIEASVYAAAETKDSRFLFPIVNLYKNAGKRFDEKKHKQIKISILNALTELQDPRAIDFLTSLKEYEDLQNIVENCIFMQDSSKRFLYTFAGSEDILRKAKDKKVRILITKPEDFYTLIEYPELEGAFRNPEGDLGPLTYIVDETGRLVIGGTTEEHVVVAQGEKVLAAGQMTISFKQEKSPSIKHMDNASNGYYPARTTSKILEHLLDHLKIEHPGKFTYLHPRDGFFSDDFLSLFPLHPNFEKN